MIAYEPGALTWRKSSFSNGANACVEVSPGPVVAVRDSKHPTGPTLAFDPSPWRAFLTTLG